MRVAEPSASEHPATWKFDYPIYHAETRDQWRLWLELNHEIAPGAWLCSWRSSAAGSRCPYPEAVEEAIRFGWIDSTISILDDDRALQLFTLRKPKSSWTRLNRQRAEEMERLGLMTDAGRRVVQAAKENGWWTIYDAVEDLIEPKPLRDALDDNAEARANWDRFPPSARKQMLWWVISAAKEETQARRVEQIVTQASVGERAKG
jgi:uncharacterized protein YdeI (YjbR/CyaY-like superfamily)